MPTRRLHVADGGGDRREAAAHAEGRRPDEDYGNFGSTGDTLLSVQVHDETRHRRFETRDACNLTVPHTELVCMTPPGPLGSRLIWNLVVDGLQSMLPTTSSHNFIPIFLPHPSL